ncbi:hypothetical protein EG329_008524 [Mollisiaceae sp. DMI_Dod_QoI]|nr:hypothetical protein EG329_008524 [Helotiales sp. DMI_Dod_QoI]
MNPPSFELFPTLPAELRNEIWIAALPQPRFVRIERVDEDYDESKYDDIILFAQNKMGCLGTNVRTDPAKICADVVSEIIGGYYEPLLQRFQRVFSRREWGTSQTQLEAHGFKTNKPQPDLKSLRLLEECGREVIYDTTFTRYLWSRTPIPALLHTCRDSRRAMQLSGYELAFAAKNTEPRIWFNFKHDVLYPTGRYWATEVELRVFDNGPWNLHCLPSKDLIRVEKLALEESWEPEAVVNSLIETVPLAGHLKELFWVEAHVPIDWHEYCMGNAGEEGKDEWGHREVEGDLWGYLECDSMEFIDNEITVVDGMGYFHGKYAREVLAYRKRNGGSSEGFFSLMNTETMDMLQRQKENRSGTWMIPTIKRVYIVTKQQAGIILTRREQSAKRMRDVEKYEEEEGPRPEDRLLRHFPETYWAPFADDYEALLELTYEYW